jgi:cytochrome o ubiquinol oxidase subunit 2
MPERHKNRLSSTWIALFVTFGLVDLVLLMRRLLLGKNVSLFNPQGSISHEQHSLFILIVIVLCAAAIPVVLFLYFAAWKFRESNPRAIHTSHVRRGKLFVFSIWTYPILMFFVMSAILIPATYRLEPHKALASDQKPLVIQAIALQWKWLFLYPEQHIASVNYVQLPADRPVRFELTADNTPMSSFWIPNIGGQLYAMTGHVNKLNLLAETVGTYRGTPAEINGAGFADMTFMASVTSPSDFGTWASSMQQNRAVLDAATYDTLMKPSENNPPAYYGSYQNDLYDTVLMKYMGHKEHG